jgi:hypothetical protein
MVLDGSFFVVVIVVALLAIRRLGSNCNSQTFSLIFFFFFFFYRSDKVIKHIAFPDKHKMKQKRKGRSKQHDLFSIHFFLNFTMHQECTRRMSHFNLFLPSPTLICCFLNPPFHLSHIFVTTDVPVLTRRRTSPLQGPYNRLEYEQHDSERERQKGLKRKQKNR